MKRLILALLCALCVTCLASAALADSAGVLSEGELNMWLEQLKNATAAETPMNAPINEDALTDDGYAFIYSFATLYYDKPALDGESVLRAVSLTGDYPAPRGLKIGGGQSGLIESFAWRNPTLRGDEVMAALYGSDELPRAAYWCLAQHDGGELMSVQCAVHASAGDARYTDAGLLFTLEDGAITGIRAYGLDALCTEADVRGNLDAVADVEAAAGGDGAAKGYTRKHDAPPFSEGDLRFGGIDALKLTEAGAERLFGKAASVERVQDDTGDTLLSASRDGLTLGYVSEGGGARERLESFSLTKDLLEGPRGLRVGASNTDEAIAAFGSDGAGRVLDGAAVLYGDGANAPSGLLRRAGDGAAELTYTADTADGRVTLRLSFVNDKLSELLIYTW